MNWFTKYPFFWRMLMRIMALIAGLVNPYLDIKWKIVVFILVCMVAILDLDAENRPKWLNVSNAFIVGLLVSYIIYPVFQ
ncbi:MULTISPECIES: hypothetical protein [Paenibacillus]|uniref:hypothetical protein n=1 Tax=Paenibacillus TaxID=44249 RepID=UPI00067689C8|nr:MULTISPECIES: hypothetical protein [Paenibacillus]AZH30587.1 hypothetical protein EGM68_18345 [Paenibacillus sp. M-152]MBY7739327.1 hypothetical protein [Paenibacillus polymyxa]MDN4085075.1 hypothetical protein [Paenibacillus polymyxa]MDN4088626.1 hypothetical protein [Paenibacillus polymyxa]MDN4108073.1 hypothetical protein [Paenibacillus polymyxa]